MTFVDLRSITDIAPRIASGELSPVTLVRTCLARIDARAGLNAFISVLGERAMHEAEHAEREIGSGTYRGPLHGVPVSVKDLVDLVGTPTTSGSAVPARQPHTDADVVVRLRKAGAIIIGKTNLHEFAFGTTGDDTAFGRMGNPFDPSRSAGGSSSGAAIALVEGMCFASIGTDTGGSIRIPAAACGTVGLKPSYGEVSARGVVALSRTCDHVGPLTRTVADARMVFQCLTDSPASAASPPRSATIGVPTGYLLDRLDDSVRAALDGTRQRLERAGFRVRDVTIRRAEITPDVYLHIVLPESSEFHPPLLRHHAQAYSPNVRLRLEMGRYVLAEDYIRAMHLRAALTTSVDRALQGCDALLLPALAIPAPPLGAAEVVVGGVTEPVRAMMLRLTQLFNLTGHPAIALPAGRNEAGLPLGMQLVGRRQETMKLLDLAARLEPLIG